MESTLSRPPLLRRLVNLVAPREVMEFWLNHLNPLWSTDQCLARVVSRDRAADGAVSIVLQPNRHFKGFRAGQHVAVKVEIDGIAYARSYSPTNAPGDSGRLRIIVRELEGGKVSSFLQTIPVDAIVRLGPAFGDLHMPTDNPLPTVMLAAGSGITPMLALIEQEAKCGFSRPLTLYYWARTHSEMIERDALIAMSSSIFQVNLIATSEHGRIDRNQLRGMLSTGTNVIACGPHGFVETARSLTSSSCATFQAESFSLPHTATHNHETGTSEVRLLRSGQTITVPRNQSLLEALEANGMKPAHGCRMGICNTCSCRKSNGTARNLLDGKLHREVSQSIRICVHAAQSDLTLDL